MPLVDPYPHREFLENSSMFSQQLFEENNPLQSRTLVKYWCDLLVNLAVVPSLKVTLSDLFLNWSFFALHNDYIYFREFMHGHTTSFSVSLCFCLVLFFTGLHCSLQLFFSFPYAKVLFPFFSIHLFKNLFPLASCPPPPSLIPLPIWKGSLYLLFSIL